MIRVLLAEDDADLLMLVAMRLSDAGYKVDTAVSGIETIGKAKAGTHDILILDIRMPDKDGLEVLGELRGLPNTKDLPVIVVSGYSSTLETLRQKASVLGVAGYLFKPYDSKELIRQIDQLTGNDRKGSNDKAA